MRRLALALALLLALTPAAALADNSAVAVNTTNNSSIFDLSFKIERVASAIVNTANQAIAYASCTACQTVAIAIDVVFVTGNPTTYQPTNVAIAVNDKCSACNTLAMAYQFVIATPGPVRLTEEGRREVHDIMKDLEALRKSDASIAEIRASVISLMAELQHVLKTELTPVDEQGNHQDGPQGTDGSQKASPSREATPTSSPASTGRTAPQQQPTPTPTASPSGSPKP